jgi:hypothetical protein
MNEEQERQQDDRGEAPTRREAESEKRLVEAERRAARASKRAKEALEELEHDGAQPEGREEE